MKYLHDHKIYNKDDSYSQSIFAGTLPYTAPEIIQKKSYNNKVDVYSFSIIMYEVLTDSIPYPDLHKGILLDHEFRSKVINEYYRPKFRVPIKKSLRQLIEKCWSKDPNERPSFDEIYSKLSNINNLDSNEDDKSQNYILDLFLISHNMSSFKDICDMIY